MDYNGESPQFIDGQYIYSDGMSMWESDAIELLQSNDTISPPSPSDGTYLTNANT